MMPTPVWNLDCFTVPTFDCIVCNHYNSKLKKQSELIRGFPKEFIAIYKILRKDINYKIK